MTTQTALVGLPKIEYLRVENYRALKCVEMKNIDPLTVLLGPNGSGKSTVFDVFAFLAECFTDGLRKAMDRRGRFRELRTRGSNRPIVIELKYREAPYARHDPRTNQITYHLAIAEGAKGPIVAEEWLHWTRQGGKAGRPFKFLDLAEGNGEAISGELPDDQATRTDVHLDSPDILGVNTLGQFADHPRVSALRRFITGWYLSYLSSESVRNLSEAGPQERLTARGDNLSNVIQYLKESHEERLTKILAKLRQRVPRLEDITAIPMADSRLLLQIKDAPFDEPIQAKYASDGTLKMLAYLVVLGDPEPPPLIGIEEPENHLHPRLLAELAEECRAATAHSQVMVTTHSPHFVNALRPEELWMLYRDESGFTQARCVKDMPGITALINEGATLGDLWMENYFEGGDPLFGRGGL